MSPRAGRYWRAVTRNEAETSPSAQDRRLRGRTYPIPFEDVWQTLVTLVDGELRGWRLRSADDQRGRARAEADVLFGRAVAAVDVRIGLDEDGQTRVDASAAVSERRADFGASVRRLGALFRALDDALARDRAARSDAESRAADPAG